MSALVTLRKRPYRTSNILQALVVVLALFCVVCDSLAMDIEGPYLYVGRIPCELLLILIYTASLLHTAWFHRQQRFMPKRRAWMAGRSGWSLPILLALVFILVAEIIGTASLVSRWNADSQEREATGPGYEEFRASLLRCLPGEHHCTVRNMAWFGILALTIAYALDVLFTCTTRWPEDQGEVWERGQGAVPLPPGTGAAVVPLEGQEGGDKDRQYFRLDNVKNA